MKIKYYSNFKKQFSLFLLLSVFLSSVFTLNSAAESTPSRSSYKLFGYISDLPNAAAKIKEGFTVSIIGTTLSSKTDSNGYIEIDDIPAGSKVNILISKPGFLSREIKNIDASSDLYLGSIICPVDLWAGDILRNGTYDNIINMADIIEIAKGFNSSVGEERYNPGYDLNMDKSINMADIIMVAPHFNKTTQDYSPISFGCGLYPGNFVKVQGKDLIKSFSGEKVLLDGVCFGNEVWSNPSIPPQYHHNELDFQRLTQMHMNAIRFYLNYNLFEDDSNPYNYKQSGWDWLDKNIEWAKKYGINLIFNMHVPQGGYQSNGDGMQLWNDRENQLRLIALWKAIASRYKDESIIAGFDILNEPVCPTSVDQWQVLANEIVSGIRSVDKNHVIIVERTNGVKSDWTTYGKLNFFKIDDPNIMYTFHFYTPIEYTHQLTSWTSYYNQDGGVYPDTNRIVVPSDTTWADGSFSNPALPLGNSDWKYFEGVKYKVTNPQIITGKPVIASDNNLGAAYFDNFIIKEYDENGTFLKNITDTNITSTDGWQYWSQDGNGYLSLSDSQGHDDSTCLAISSTTGPANAYNDKLRFKAVYGHYYSISGWMKGENISSSNNTKFRVDFEKSPSGSIVMVRDKNYLNSEIKRFADWGNENNVPLYLGEFGLYRECFLNDKGGLNWVSDMLDLLDTYGISHTYHAYHEYAFGIYYTNGLPDDNSANTGLINIFKSRSK